MRRLGATFLVLVLVSAGCLTASDRGPAAPATDEPPGPGAPLAEGPVDPAPRVTVAGPWRFTATPGEVVGAPGDVARVRLAIERAGNATGGTLGLAPFMRWADVPETESWTPREVPEAGATWDVEVLVGPAPHVAFSVWWEDSTGEGPERWPSRAVNASAVFVSFGNAVETRARDNYVPTGSGLNVTTEGSTLVATFTEGVFLDIDCDAVAGAAGPFRLVESHGTRTLVGFVKSGQSDSCLAPATPRAPRVIAKIEGLEPGEVRVVVYAHRTCFCAPTSWTVFEANATVG
ncbi:MAG TPA: hypothetical protein VM889_04630 [Candidatus Thermoplasmatota archaeon]|nr:hypothetical protein [Candidatus Thermoplasmatota archaeon]